MNNIKTEDNDNAELPNELVDALIGFERTAKQIAESLHKSVGARKPPQLLYHYTNDVGLKGILESGQLWLSDIFSLNDPSELSHGISHAANILNSMAETGPQETKEFARLFMGFCQDGLRESANYFVCSFSGNDNDLGQWRAYADNGRGYALEFDAEALAANFMKDVVPNHQGNNTFPMKYDDDIADVHRQLIEGAFPLISKPYTNSIGNQQINTFLMYLSELLSLFALETALYFKHKAYVNESEFRFLQIFRGDIPLPNVKWRPRSNELVRYREFAWRVQQPRVLKRIVIGPAADYPKATRFVEDCLKSYHTEQVEIIRSAIPYRAV